MTFKNCNTCAYRNGFTYEYGDCLLSGYSCTTERKFPTRCGVDFDEWVYRKTIFVRIKEWFFGVKE